MVFEGQRLFLQIEGNVDIRKLVRTPRKGDLPLSSSADKAALEKAPSKVEDLNEVVPKSGQQLATPQKHPKVNFFGSSWSHHHFRSERHWQYGILSMLVMRDHWWSSASKDTLVNTSPERNLLSNSFECMDRS